MRKIHQRENVTVLTQQIEFQVTDAQNIYETY